MISILRMVRDNRRYWYWAALYILVVLIGSTLQLVDCFRAWISDVIVAMGTERVFYNMRERAYERLLRIQLSVIHKQAGTGEFAVRLNKMDARFGHLSQ